MLSRGWTPLTDGTSSMFHIEYMNKKTGTLHKKGRDELNDLYKNNQKIRDEIINFDGDKTELGNEKIIDKRLKKILLLS